LNARVIILAPVASPALLLATTNPGKVREIRRALAGLNVPIHALADLPSVAEPEETGRTFAENARLKAAYYAHLWPGWTIGEDSGLEVDALAGAPGVFSARYPGATYPDKFANLYRELAPHPRPWTARYVCAIAVIRGSEGSEPAGARRAVPDAARLLFECSGVVEGEIAPAPHGANGFGYDPIFFYPPFGRTFGEISDEEKLSVSHRGRAFAMLREWLQEAPL
jgi:XTP/dITP diphosphohydrolase